MLMRKQSDTQKTDRVTTLMVTRAKTRHPDSEIVSADSWEGGPSATVVVCSGALNTPVDDNASEELRSCETTAAIESPARSSLSNPL